MKAALLEEFGRLRLGSVPDPEPQPDEVLVRVRATAICGTDVSIWKGKQPVRLPLVPGHECTGVVAEVGREVGRLRPGDRVVLDPLTFCRRCYYCERGLTNLCERGGLRGREAPGCFAQFVAVAESEAHPLPDGVSFEAATNFVGLYTVVYSQRKCPYITGSSVAILGQGSAGLLHTQLAKASGAGPVIAITRSQWKLEVAARLGADVCINARSQDPVEEVRRLTCGRGADVVIESAGVPETMRQALQMVRPAGTILQFGIGPKTVDGLDGQALYFKDLTVVGSRAGLAQDFALAVKLVAAGKVDLEPLVTHRYPLERIQEGFEFVDQGGDGKTLRAVVQVAA